MESNMTQEEFQLPRHITNQLLHLAQLSPEQEVCGLIGEKEGIANTCYPIQNTDKQPDIRFQLDSKQHIQALATMREKDETLCAIYHSHPTAPATPSPTDIKLATYSDSIYLIISLNTKGVLEIRGFKMVANSFHEVSLSSYSEA
jgi:proteasome lid subunit RPN8/RPN11